MSMYVIFVRSYRKKLLIAGVFLLLCLLAAMAAGLFMQNRLSYTVTINDSVSFSYPLAFDIGNVYLNEQKEEASIQTNINFRKPLLQKFNSYNSLNGKFSFDYPSLFTVSEKTFAGSDILYHVELENKKARSHGFVQVWNLTHPLESFLKASFETSRQVFKDFKSRTVAVGELPGYYWDYSVLGSDGVCYKALEVFLSREDQMYRISYFCPEGVWNEEQEQTFWDMAASIRLLD